MDPDASLAAARRAAAAIQVMRDRNCLVDPEVVELVEAFQALDQWVDAGGFLPQAWQASVEQATS